MKDIFETILLPLGEHAGVTVYGCIIGCAAVLACVLTLLLCRSRKLKVDQGLSLCLCGVLGAVAMGRIFYLAANYTITEAYMEPDFHGTAFLWSLWMGGYNLYGAILGGLGAIALYACCTKTKLSACADVMAPGMVLVVMAERFAEFFTDQGLGHYLDVADEEAGIPFPIGIQGQSGEFQLPVFFYDGVLLALVLIAVLLVFSRARTGRAAEVAVALVGLVMIVTESLREDDIIRFGFVRFNQLCAAITVAFVLFLSMARKIRAGGWKPWQIVRLVLFLLGVGLVIGIEFALDKSTIDNTILYGVMVAVVTVMGVAVLKEGKAEA